MSYNPLQAAMKQGNKEDIMVFSDFKYSWLFLGGTVLLHGQNSTQTL